MRTAINPFYTSSTRRSKTVPVAQVREPVYAKLPLAPINASPVPHLTSLYHNARAGEYGNRSYPGNCGGNLIKDLLLYFQPHLVCDPMAGSGTCRDVCQELAIPCMSWASTMALTPATQGPLRPQRRLTSSGLIRPTGGWCCTPTIPETYHEHQRWKTSCAGMASSSATVRGY